VPTEGNQEDVVPMGMTAAWKGERILANAARIVAIELLAAAQGLEFLHPLKPGRGVARTLAAVRRLVPPLVGDRALSGDIERITAELRAGRLDPEAPWRFPLHSPFRTPRSPLRRCGNHERSQDRPCTSRTGAILQGLGPGGRAADADEQPRPR